MYSNRSSAASSRVAYVCACTHSDFTMPMSDFMAALSRVDEIDPIDGRIPRSRMVFDRSSDTYCEPWSE